MGNLFPIVREEGFNYLNFCRAILQIVLFIKECHSKFNSVFEKNLLEIFKPLKESLINVSDNSKEIYECPR